MRSHYFFVIASGLVLSAIALLAQQQSIDGDLELKSGIQAYKDGRFEDAKQHFQRAVTSDPKNEQARLYLGTAYAQEYIPGVDTPENNLLGQRAIEQYKVIVELNKSNATAAKSIGYLLQQMKKFDAAEEYYRKAIEIDPKDPESYYYIGVLDWVRTFQPRMEKRAMLKLAPEQTLIRRAECWSVRDTNRERVEDGIEMLRQAIELRRDYDDAMAYVNLMYREKADIECGDAKANASDLKTADQWVDQTIAAKKKKDEKRPTPSPRFDLPQ